MTKQTAPTSQNSGPDQKKWLKNAAYIVLIILLLALAAGGVYAKYVYSNAAMGTVLAGEFYFTSDRLTVDGAAYSLNPGTQSVSFALSNHADNLRVSSDDIGYTVTVEGEGATLSSTSGTLGKGAISDATITLSGLKDGGTYTVTAVGEAGYKETLEATFTVLTAGTGVYKHLDTSDPAYVVLTIWTENVTGKVAIEVPAGLIPDSTDPILAEIQNYDNDTGKYTGTSFSDNTSFDDPYSSRTYRFFKTSDYAGGSFTVTLTLADTTTSITAEDATP